MKTNKIKYVVMIAILLGTNVSFIHANETKEDSNSQSPDYDSYEKTKQRQSKIDNANNYLNAKAQQRAGAKVVLNVPLYLQDNEYYCGPAATQMIIAYKTGSIISQSYLAGQMGTTVEGTIVYRLANVLRSYTGASYYEQHISQYALMNALVTDVDANYPLVLNVLGSHLDGYYPSDGGHFIVGTGYEYWSFGSSGGSNVYFNDSFNGRSGSFGRKVISSARMENAIAANNGYYIW